VVAWDGGDLDLVNGSSEGGVQWAENRAGPGKPPQLKRFRSLIDPGPRPKPGQIVREADLKGPANCSRIWVDDVNTDGKLDILIGNMLYLVSLLQQAKRIHEVGDDGLRLDVRAEVKSSSSGENETPPAIPRELPLTSGVFSSSDTAFGYHRLQESTRPFVRCNNNQVLFDGNSLPSRVSADAFPLPRNAARPRFFPLVEFPAPPELDRGARYGRLLGAPDDLDASYSVAKSTKMPGSTRK
jgi:hypothetical protein